MGNCLVTKLESVINDDNLDYFDALQIKVDWDVFKGDGSYVDFRIRESFGGNHFGGVGVKVKVLNNGVIKVNDVAIADDEYIVESGKKVYIAPIGNNYSVNTEFLLIGLSNIDMLATNNFFGYTIKNANTQNYLSLNPTSVGNFFVLQPYLDSNRGNVDISDLLAKAKNKESIRYIIGSLDSPSNPHIYLTTESFAGFTELEEISYFMYVSYGDIAYLSELTALKRLILRWPGVNGNISSLGALTALVSFNFNGSSIVGAIEEFVAAQYNATNNPRKSASGATRILMYFDASTNITFGGNKITIANKYLAWDDGGIAPTNIRIENS